LAGGDGDSASVVAGGESEAGFVEVALDVVDDPDVDEGICGDNEVTATVEVLADGVEAAVLDCSDSSISPR
jgi:flavin-dependent dehydrogenase